MSVAYNTAEDQIAQLLEDENVSQQYYESSRIFVWFNTAQDQLALVLPEEAIKSLIQTKSTALDAAGTGYAIPSGVNNEFLKHILARESTGGVIFNKIEYTDAQIISSNSWTTPSKRQAFCYFDEQKIYILPDAVPFQGTPASNLEHTFIRRPTRVTESGSETLEFDEQHVPMLIYMTAATAADTSPQKNLAQSWWLQANNLLNTVWMSYSGKPSPHMIGPLVPGGGGQQ